jgi:hypothetical protein
MALPIGTREIPWLSDRDRLKQQFYEEVKFRLDAAQNGTNTEVLALISEGASSAQTIAYRAITTDQLGQIIHADSNTLAHADVVLGVSINAANSDGLVRYVTAGQLTNPSWNFTPTQPIFLGPDGQLTHNPNTGIVQSRIGYALTATTIQVRIGLSIAL